LVDDDSQRQARVVDLGREQAGGFQGSGDAQAVAVDLRPHHQLAQAAALGHLGEPVDDLRGVLGTRLHRDLGPAVEDVEAVPGANDVRSAFCVYESPDRESVLAHAEALGLPVERCFEVETDLVP
jgi:hypothetical protein